MSRAFRFVVAILDIYLGEIVYTQHNPRLHEKTLKWNEIYD